MYRTCWACFIGPQTNCVFIAILAKSDPAKHWADFGLNSGWVEKEASECLEPISRHPLFSLPGVSEIYVVLDVLHVIDHNGVAGHLLGSIMHMLILSDTNRTWASRNVALRNLWVRLQEL